MARIIRATFAQKSVTSAYRDFRQSEGLDTRFTRDIPEDQFLAEKERLFREGGYVVESSRTFDAASQPSEQFTTYLQTGTVQSDDFTEGRTSVYTRRAIPEPTEVKPVEVTTRQITPEAQRQQATEDFTKSSQFGQAYGGIIEKPEPKPPLRIRAGAGLAATLLDPRGAVGFVREKYLQKFPIDLGVQRRSDLEKSEQILKNIRNKESEIRNRVFAYQENVEKIQQELQTTSITDVSKKYPQYDFVSTKEGYDIIPKKIRKLEKEIEQDIKTYDKTIEKSQDFKTFGEYGSVGEVTYDRPDNMYSTLFPTGKSRFRPGKFARGAGAVIATIPFIPGEFAGIGTIAARTKVTKLPGLAYKAGQEAVQFAVSEPEYFAGSAVASIGTSYLGGKIVKARQPKVELKRTSTGAAKSKFLSTTDPFGTSKTKVRTVSRYKDQVFVNDKPFESPRYYRTQRTSKITTKPEFLGDFDYKIAFDYSPLKDSTIVNIIHKKSGGVQVIKDVSMGTATDVKPLRFSFTQPELRSFISFAKQPDVRLFRYDIKGSTAPSPAPKQKIVGEGYAIGVVKESDLKTFNVWNKELQRTVKEVSGTPPLSFSLGFRTRITSSTLFPDLQYRLFRKPKIFYTPKKVERTFFSKQKGEGQQFLGDLEDPFKFKKDKGDKVFFTKEAVIGRTEVRRKTSAEPRVTESKGMVISEQFESGFGSPVDELTDDFDVSPSGFVIGRKGKPKVGEGDFTGGEMNLEQTPLQKMYSELYAPKQKTQQPFAFTEQTAITFPQSVKAFETQRVSLPPINIQQPSISKVDVRSSNILGVLNVQGSRSLQGTLQNQLQVQGQRQLQGQVQRQMQGTKQLQQQLQGQQQVQKQIQEQLQGQQQVQKQLQITTQVPAIVPTITPTITPRITKTPPPPVIVKFDDKPKKSAFKLPSSLKAPKFKTGFVPSAGALVFGFTSPVQEAPTSIGFTPFQLRAVPVGRKKKKKKIKKKSKRRKR